MAEENVPGVDARHISGAEVEPMGEFVRLVFEGTDGQEFIIRIPTEDFTTALPNLLTLPGRAQAVADPIGTPVPAPGSPGRARALPAGAAVIRTNTGTDQVLFELHIGWPLYPVFFSFPRDKAREVFEQALAALSKDGGD